MAKVSSISPDELKELMSMRADHKQDKVRRVMFEYFKKTNDSWFERTTKREPKPVKIKESVIFEDKEIKIVKFKKPEKSYYELTIKDNDGTDDGFSIHMSSLDKLKKVHESLGRVINIETPVVPRKTFNRFADIDMSGD